MRKTIMITLILCLCAVSTSCNTKTKIEAIPTEQEKDISLIIASDLHYLSPTINDGGEFFTNMMENADGKYTLYSSQIVDAFIEEVLQKKPDALIISGDLTFNGEKISHEEISEKLLLIQNKGTAVLVIPGNHDIEYPYAYSYFKDEAERVENVSQQEFEKIYSLLGRKDALAKDENSYSYIYPLSSKVRILMLDCNTVDDAGIVTEKTMNWVKAQLKLAEKEGAAVITVTHQNILPPNSLFSRGFVINNSQEVLNVLEKNKVLLNLSGHSHLQHISTRNNFTDIISGSMAGSPHLYGEISITSQGEFNYTTHSVNVADWAKKHGLTDLVLLDFAKQSESYFNNSTYRQVKEALIDANIHPQLHESMIDFAVQVNKMYFAGSISRERENFIASNSWKLWQAELKNSFWGLYLSSILNEDEKDSTSYTGYIYC